MGWFFSKISDLLFVGDIDQGVGIGCMEMVLQNRIWRDIDDWSHVVPLLVHFRRKGQPCNKPNRKQ